MSNYCIIYIGERGLQGKIGKKGATGINGIQGPPGKNTTCILGNLSQILIGTQVNSMAITVVVTISLMLIVYTIVCAHCS